MNRRADRQIRAANKAKRSLVAAGAKTSGGRCLTCGEIISWRRDGASWLIMSSDGSRFHTHKPTCDACGRFVDYCACNGAR